MPEPLEIASQSLAAILATWLGLTVLSRAPSQRGPRVFAWVTFLLLTWSVAILVERTTSDPTVAAALNAVEDLAAFLLPAAALHIVLAFTVEGPYSPFTSSSLVVAYVVGAGFGIQHVVDPGHHVGLASTDFQLGGVPAPVIGWLWVLFRIAVFGLAIALAAQAYARSSRDPSRRGQTLAALVTVSLASVGGTLRFLPREIGGPNWVGVSLITLALIVATYAVFGQGIFLSHRAIQSAFRSSLLAGVAVAIYVAVLGALEALAEPILHTGLPIVMVLALVATVALFDPVRERFQRLVIARTPRELAYRRLSRALGIRQLTDESPEAAVQPALDRLATVLTITQARVTDATGAVVASVGEAIPDGRETVRRELMTDDRSQGVAMFGARRDGARFTQRDLSLIESATQYFAASLDVGGRRRAQADALASLGTEQQALVRSGTRLSETLSGPSLVTVRVHAWGPFRVERHGELIRHWGGPKAGSRQAEAIFAFLFDRGARGATKDEMTEVVWPDIDIDRADLAFHRTLVGLRSVLEPSRPRRGSSETISFHNDRYRLNPLLVEWTDVAAVEELVKQAGATSDRGAALHLLEEARSLIRGDYLEDCPFYGDSEYVEERRRLIRGRQVDLLVTLGERYEAQEDRPAAANAFREALLVAGGECAPAVSGLERLGVPA